MPVFIFVIWILLNGRVTAELVIFGILISAAVSLFAYKVTGYAPANDPEVVVAIVLEEAIDSEDSDNAALKSRNVLQTALQIKGIL